MAVPWPFSSYGLRPPRRAAVGRSGWRHNTAGGTQRPSTTTLPWTTRTTPRRLALGPAPQSSAGRHCNLTAAGDKSGISMQHYAEQAGSAGAWNVTNPR